MTKPAKINKVIWDGSQWVAGSEGSATDQTKSVLFTSPDATNWTPVPYLSDPLGGTFEDYNSTSPYDGTRYNAGDAIDIDNVPDGNDPVVREAHAKQYGYGSKLPSTSNIWTLYGTNTLGTHAVALAFNTNNAAYTDDTGTWIATTLPYSARWTAVATDNNGKWVAVSGDGTTYSNKAAISTDNGRTWVANTLPYTENWTDINFMNGVFVACAGIGSSYIIRLIGNTWVTSFNPSTGNWRTLVNNTSKFFNIKNNSNQFSSSTNGASWAAGTLPLSAGWNTSVLGFTTNQLNSKSGTHTDTVTYSNVLAHEVPIRTFTDVTAVVTSHPNVKPELTQVSGTYTVNSSDIDVHMPSQIYLFEAGGPKYTLANGWIIGYNKEDPSSNTTTEPSTYYWKRNGANVTASVNQTFAIAGTQVGGTSPANDFTIKVTAVDGSGYVSAVSLIVPPGNAAPVYINARMRVNVVRQPSGQLVFSNWTIVWRGNHYVAGQTISFRSPYTPYYSDANGEWPLTVVTTFTEYGDPGAIGQYSGTELVSNGLTPTLPSFDITINKYTKTYTISPITLGSGWGPAMYRSNGLTDITFSIDGTKIGGITNDSIVIKMGFGTFSYTDPLANNTNQSVYVDYAASGLYTTIEPGSLTFTVGNNQRGTYNYLNPQGYYFSTKNSTGSYNNGDTFRITGDKIGGVTGVNDIYFIVTTAGDFGLLGDTTIIGTPVAGAMPIASITKDKTTYTTGTITSSPVGYKIGDIVGFSGADLSGTSAYNSTGYTVTSVNGSGNITGLICTTPNRGRYANNIRFNVTRTGTVYTATLIDSNYTGAQENVFLRIHSINVGGSGSTLTPTDYNTNANDVLITIDSVIQATGDLFYITNFTVSGTGLASIEPAFNITRKNRVYTVATISDALSGTGFVPGQSITIVGSNLDGIDGTHNLTITVATIKNALIGGVYKTGVISTFTFSGTAFVGAMIIGASSGDKVLRSLDGVNWSIVTLPSSASVRGITYGINGLNGYSGLYTIVQEGSDQYFTSVDGITWSQHTLKYSSAWKDVTFFYGRFHIYDNTRWGITSTLTDNLDAAGWISAQGLYESPWTTTAITEVIYSGGKYLGFGYGILSSAPTVRIPLLWSSTTISSNKGDWSIYPSTGVPTIISSTDTGTEVLVTDGAKVYAVPSNISETNTTMIERAGPFGEAIIKLKTQGSYVYVITPTKTLVSNK